MMESLSPNNKRLIGELIKGRDSTHKLLNLLRRNNHNDSAEDLIMKILRSFSDSLSMLTSGDSYPVSACSGDRRFDSGQSKRKPAPAPVVKDRRGCYKRRKTEDSRVKIVDRIEDGFAWRKYGQKEILYAKSPRCYFRCTHKNEGCKALKQVQKLEDGSEKFHVIYIGHHTCQNVYQNTQMFSDSGGLSFFLLNFDDYNSPCSLSAITNVHNTPLMEQEDDSNAQSGSHVASNANHGQSSIPMWKDMIGDLGSSHEKFFKNGGYLDGGFKFEDVF
ncbi:hypothetical protein OSB04_025917 [Centaurea solstitialis]|uniref:WRKY domain-containing protein n=1 Tax=Centaurea solstitialis TaxID=347529 RepID=A0AA38SNY7_9ASTR|nr:hypothetical protein OSB04_025917 [Centaurea solstitialis]